MKKRRSSAARVLVSVTLAVLFSLSIIAQSAGTLTGIVVDAQTGGPVRGATVVVEGTALKTTADINGLFALNVPPGTYRIAVSNAGYGSQTLSEVVIAAGAENNLGVVLEPSGGAAAPQDEESMRLAEFVTVMAQADSTEEALLVERKTADEISDSVGRQEISKGSASNSAGVMQRVTGVSLVDDKYVYVRGLGERYSNTTMNGTIIPSTEPEKRVIPLDLFSANLLNKITVLKSYTPDKAGEFAAGFVELETLDFPSRPTASLTLGASYYDGTTGENVLRYGNGLGFSGSGGLAMPSTIPMERVVRGGVFGGGLTAGELQQVGRSFQKGWEAQPSNASPNPSFSLTLGNTFGRLGLVISASHSETIDFTEEEQSFYSLGVAGGPLKLDHDYDFQTTEEAVRQGLVANLSVRLGNNHQVKLRTFGTEVATSEVRNFEGFNSDAFNNIRDNRLRYQNEQILTGKLSGDHFFQGLGFGDGGGLFEWTVSPSRGERQENSREVIYREVSPGRYLFAEESQSGLLLYNDLVDEVLEYGGNWSSFISGPRVNGSVKIGAMLVDRERDFSSRRFRFVPQNRTAVDLSLAPDELFADENIAPGRFEIGEETRATDSYAASHEIGAVFMMGDLAFGRWRVIGGARLEDSNQEVVTRDLFNPTSQPITTVNDDSDVLPALNIVYQLTPSMNLRTAFSQTVNRPEFRELAPFEFSDVVGGRAIVGNPNLTRALIRSYDLRWEWFPTGAEVIAASLFLKEIDDPIEQVIQPTAQLRTSYANAESATNYGLELEFRRDLKFLGPAFAPWSFTTNYTYIDSSVEIGEVDLSIVTSLERPLAGQSDNVFNATLEFAPRRTGTTVRALYNFTGAKISDVGALGIPDIYEADRDVLDLVVLQDLGLLVPGLRLKLAVENLTSEDRLFTQAGEQQRRYSPGSEYSISINYNFF